MQIDILNTSMSQAGEIYFYLAAIACIDGKMKKVEADLLKELGQKLNLPVDFQKAVMKWGINQMNHNQRWSQEQNILNQQKDVKVNENLRASMKRYSKHHRTFMRINEHL